MNKTHLIGWVLILTILLEGYLMIKDIELPKEEPLQVVQCETLEEVEEVETSSVTKEPMDIDLEATKRATFRQETGNGTSKVWLNQNNAGGIMINKYEYYTYPTKEDGYRAMETLVERYYNKYGTDFKSWRKEYCGIHCGKKDLDEFVRLFKEEKEKIENE